jgi:hypothetical protein
MELGHAVEQAEARTMTSTDRAALKSTCSTGSPRGVATTRVPTTPGARFDALALRLFAFTSISRRLPPLHVRGATPGPVRSVAKFARSRYRLQVGASRHRCRRKLRSPSETSGTTDGHPGRVTLHDTSLYDASLHAGFQHFVVPDAAPGGLRCISLVPGPAERPHSLGHMVRGVPAVDDGGGSSHRSSFRAG